MDKPTYPLARYLLFGGADYYARGGAWDLLGSYATIEEATAMVRVARGGDVEWTHIVDSHTGVTTAYSGRHEPVTTQQPDYYYQDTLDE
jgi:hypothetical protein